MQAFTVLDGLVMPLDRANVDTDALIPKQFIKSIERSGFGPNLFDEWRYLDSGEPGQDPAQRRPNPQFVMNQARYAGASILLARENFGCGSSREHAVWALDNAGFRAVIAPSFADIFFGNCFKNGVLPIVLDAARVDALFQRVEAHPGWRARIDLSAQTLATPEGDVFGFPIDAHRKHALLEGLDDIALTLAQAPHIRAYEQRRRASEPWLFQT
ncbi:3-isopropylmalate isomerase (dehydratase), subunit with LeuC [Thiomonas sp. X19]|uniref:3-isopropylmalate dehydratase small subunit n=1 Tax=Thiomonas sp. X19 TaxID=1050370 RepID=UPI000B669315|nr:3-isopropylmalate dehydratase small subunit [Thiomonas sp. X19]SCC95806.1 3-isopropylmalate isomerase (dehydratase), subunit with LeuC [Thiomonas sp. X19]